jgi:hypothetical protein
MEASGIIPTPELDGDKADLRLDGGERGGLDCVCKSSSRGLSTNTRDLCALFLFYEVLCVKLYIVHPPL